MKHRPSSLVMFSVVTSFLLLAAVSINLPASLQPVLVLVNLPLIITSRVPQILTNFKQKSTGQLSLFTFLLQFAGSAIRIFTTIQEVGWDLPLLAGFAIGAALNGTILLQVNSYTIEH